MKLLKTKWKHIKDKNNLKFECPITGSNVPIIIFKEQYLSILEQLDGTTMSDYIEFWFSKNTFDVYEFIDDDSREDWIDWAVELQINPHLKDIREGND